MNSTTVAVDLAKNVFELAVADREWRIVERHRLNRTRFSRFFFHRPPCQVVMEACGSAHHWARRLVAEGHTVRREIPGVGLLTSTALLSTVGDIQRFPSGRHFACWLGLTPSERSSAERRRLGKISKQGDVYCRTLLVHGARSALLAAHRAQRAGKPLDRLRHWALNCERARGHNKATVALANRLARIVWATWKYERAFDGNWANQAA